MAAFWQFFSFEQQRWDAMFHGGLPTAERWIAAAMCWDDFEEDPPDVHEDPQGYLDAAWALASPEVRQEAHELANGGPVYCGLDAAAASRLDAIVTGFFAPEGLWEVLGGTLETADIGIAQRAMMELLSRAEPVRQGGFLGFGGRESPGFPVTMARLLVDGRRLGTQAPTDMANLYFVLAPDEVPRLLREVSGLLAVDRPWKEPEFRLSIVESLVGALERAGSAGRMLAGLRVL